MSILRIILVATLGLSAFAQAPTKPRVFITNNYFWEMLCNLGTTGDTGAVSRRGDNNLPVSRIVSSFSEKCPGFTVTVKKEKADYVLVVEGGENSKHGYAVFDKEGDALGSGSTLIMGTAIKEACDVLGKAQAALAGKNQNP
ncbi:MAG TPA: hypothetical protein VJ302_17730 [Blastocatellia bacterium]|nr:hypothetical protein [Blastocatellia bacterium]